jgi:hypothetical protein
MNNVLDYQGYRFFQSSFDPDEKQLIVNKPRFWGTAIICRILYVILP